MDCVSPDGVLSRECNHRELGSKKRNRTGFHVFLSRYFYEFKKLSIAEQSEEIKEYDDSNYDNTIENSSDDLSSID